MNSDMKKYAVIGSMLLTVILLSSCVNNEVENKEKPLSWILSPSQEKEATNMWEHSMDMDMDNMKWEWTDEEMAAMEWMDSSEHSMMDMKEWEWTEEEMANMEWMEHWSMDDDMKIEETTMIKSEWVYKDYSAEALSSAEWNIVLFFAASWCPSCKTADKNLSTETIPEWLTILKLDYDSNLDLRKKYSITSQHAFVLVDNKGNEVKKWYASRDVENILNKIK